MYYTGIDLHRKTSYLTTVNEEGRVVKKANLINDEGLIWDYLAELDGHSCGQDQERQTGQSYVGPTPEVRYDLHDLCSIH